MNVKSKYAPDDDPVKEPSQNFSYKVWRVNTLSRTHLFDTLSEFFGSKKKRKERTESGSPLKQTDQQ